MVAHVVNSTQIDERDDMQHIQTQRLLAMRVIAPPKSRLGKLIQDRLSQLYDELGESIDPAKRRELAVAGANRGAANADRDPLSVQRASRMGGVGNMGGSAQGRMRDPLGIVGPGPLGATANFGNPAIESGKPIPRAPAARTSAPTPKIKIKDPAVEQSQPSWVWMLSQLLQTDLKRLGVEPDEFDDIRILLIKNEATQFDKLQLLSRLPDSLSPDAVTKIFEDIRTMAAGYVAFVLVERAKAQAERGEEVKQLAELPRSVSSPFFGIPIIDFDPEDILKKID
jgi:hypothetical protein